MALFGLFGGNKQDKTRVKTPMSKVVRYTHMPEIFPRIRALGGRFGHFAYLLALIFRSARLLPPGHPMLNVANIGRFGIRDVIATAANGLVMKRENLDQVLIFGAIVMALLMIVVQAVLIGAAAFLGSARAADGSMFTTEHPDTDVITIFLSQTFGFQNIFGGSHGIEQPGLYALLGFYSTAMMIIAVMIVIYYVVTLVGESAQSGQPFGKRFNGLWAPVRLVLALGLLVPLGGGINAAQYLTLHVAKLGSGLASKGWVAYLNGFDKEVKLSGGVTSPDAEPLVSAIFGSEVCRAAYTQLHPSKPVHVRVNGGTYNGSTKSQPATFSDSDIGFALASGATRIDYVWSEQNDNSTISRPICGAISVPLMVDKDASGTLKEADDALRTIQQVYIAAIGDAVRGISGADGSSPPTGLSSQIAKNSIIIGNDDWKTNSKSKNFGADLAKIIDAAQSKFNNEIKITSASVANSLTKVKEDAKNRGWGTAGAYYIQMSKMSQLMLGAINRGYPGITSTADGTTKLSASQQSWWSWGREKVGIPDSDTQIRTLLSRLPAIITDAHGRVSIPANTITVDANGVERSQAQNPATSFKIAADSGSFRDPVKVFADLMFGDAFIRLVDEPTINPMEKLIAGGASILERANTLVFWYVVSQMGSVGSTLLGAGIGLMAGGPGGALLAAGGFFLLGSLLQALGGILWLFLIIGLGAGIVLFYLLPLMPFMYFFFSVVNWVIEVAEAFVSMPLFALAHLRIDGDGLPGQTAYQGWLILFGILLRPLMIIAGLVVGSLVFNAGAYYLNSIFKYAIFSYNTDASNAVGAMDFSKISGFGLITYTVMYVYLIYMLANSSFKLIDTIPDKMMRWIGGPTPFTGDRPVDIGSMQNVALMGYGAMSQAREAGAGTVDALNKGIKERSGKGSGGPPPGPGAGV